MMKSRFASGCSFLAATAAITFGAATASAAPRTHDGFYLNLHAGFGYLSVSPDTPLDITYKGLTLPSGITLGGSVIPGLVIGGTLFTHYAPSPGVSTPSGNFTLDDLSLYLVGIGPFVDFYPDPADGLHFQGSVAFGALSASSNGNTSTNDPTGLVLTVGGGYDFWVGDEWSIGPLARFTYAPLSVDGMSFSTIAPSLVANFTYH